jgi:glycosyltransferase involved in cell wall biosynthesis
MSEFKNLSIKISIIVPTKNNQEGMSTLLKSLVKNTQSLKDIEVLMIVDQGDPAPDYLFDQELSVKTIFCSPGLMMSELNQTGLSAASGEWLFFLNDDVICNTKDWDRTILSRVKHHIDSYTLIHVNDGHFKSSLCVFPFVNKAFFSLYGDLGKSGYSRYRIDDEIFGIFKLVEDYGFNRIIYFDEIHFTHSNLNSSGTYEPIASIHDEDTRQFLGRQTARAEIASQMISEIISNRFRSNDSKLFSVDLDVELRNTNQILRPRVTVAMVSGNILSPHAQEAIRRVKEFSTNIDFMVLDNGMYANFRHPREMNRIRSTVNNDYLVLMDDDVWVTPGWLEALFSELVEEVALVMPLHVTKDGLVNYAGADIVPGEVGKHMHNNSIDHRNLDNPNICSALMLLDLRKIGDLPFDTRYFKYFFDLQFGLDIFHQGLRSKICLNSSVIHLGGATVNWDSKLSKVSVDADLKRFQRQNPVSILGDGEYSSEYKSLVTELEAIVRIKLLSPSVAYQNKELLNADLRLRHAIDIVSTRPAFMDFLKSLILHQEKNRNVIIQILKGHLFGYEIILVDTEMQIIVNFGSYILKDKTSGETYSAFTLMDLFEKYRLGIHDQESQISYPNSKSFYRHLVSSSFSQNLKRFIPLKWKQSIKAKAGF